MTTLPDELPQEPGEFIISRQIRELSAAPSHAYMPQRGPEPRYGTVEQLQAEWRLLKMEEIAKRYYGYQMDMNRTRAAMDNVMFRLNMAACEVSTGGVPLANLALIAHTPEAGLQPPAPNARLYGARELRQGHEERMRVYRSLLLEVIRWAQRQA